MHKGKKLERSARKKMDLMKSKTSQNIWAGGALNIGMIMGVILFARANWPTIIPWPAEDDPKIAAGLVALFGVLPIITRQIAFWRDPSKSARPAANELISQITGENEELSEHNANLEYELAEARKGNQNLRYELAETKKKKGGYASLRVLCVFSALIALLLMTSGCAIGGTKLRKETVVLDSKTGEVIGRNITEIEESSAVSWGAKQDKNTGAVSTKDTKTTSAVSVNTDVVQSAEEPVESSNATLDILKLLSPLWLPKAAAVVEATP